MIKINWLLLLLFLAGCNVKTISKITVCYTIPLRHIDSTAEYFTTIFHISRYDGVVLYELPYKETKDEDGVLISDTILYEYFIYKEGNKSGYLLKSLRDSFKNKFDVDSLLTTRALYKLNTDSSMFPYLKNPTPVKHPLNRPAFKVSFRFNSPGVDSAYIYFDDKLIPARYALTPILDSVYDSKACKLEVLLKKDTILKPGFADRFRTITLGFSSIEKQIDADEFQLFQRMKR